LNLEEGIDFNPQTVQLAFTATDKKGNQSKVYYNQPKPQDFERSEEITMTGFATDTAFIATDILMKCPSKYNEQNEVNSDKIYK
jgi:cytochrome c-type biogenesis protein CcmE